MATECVRKVSRNDARDVISGGVQVLLHRSMCQRESMVGVVEVFARAVAKIRTEHGDPAARCHGTTQPQQELSDFLLAREVLEEIRNEHTVEVGVGQLDAARVTEEKLDVAVEKCLLVLNRIDHP